MVERLVVDCSVTLGFFRAAQASAYSDAVLATARHVRWIVPALWRSELANALVSLERRKLADAGWRKQTLQDCAQLPFAVEPESTTAERLCELALEQGLTAYDAAYLECALRHRAPLATQDAALVKAARACRLYFSP